METQQYGLSSTRDLPSGDKMKAKLYQPHPMQKRLYEAMKRGDRIVFSPGRRVGLATMYRNIYWKLLLDTLAVRVGGAQDV